MIQVDNVLQGNKLIAEFMGLDVLYGDFVHHETAEKGKVTKMKYHASWDWLMPVVEKIDKTKEGYIDIQSKNLVIAGYNHQTYKYFTGSLIENVYNAVIGFIEWYNEQNKQ